MPPSSFPAPLDAAAGYSVGFRARFGSSINTLGGGSLRNVKVQQGGLGAHGGAAPAAGPSAPGEADGGAQRPSTAKGSEPGAVKKSQQPLTCGVLLKSGAELQDSNALEKDLEASQCTRNHTLVLHRQRRP